MALCTRLLMLPPMAVMSERAKSLVASEKVKLTVALSPSPSMVLLLLMATVGAVVSAGGMREGVSGGQLVLRLTALFRSEPSLLLLPAASVKVLLDTTIMALAPVAVGVKVAV